MIVKSASCFLLTPLCKALWFCPETAGRDAQPPMPMSEGSLTANTSTQALHNKYGWWFVLFYLESMYAGSAGWKLSTEWINGLLLSPSMGHCVFMSWWWFINVARCFDTPLQGEKLLWKTPWSKSTLFFRGNSLWKIQTLKKIKKTIGI